jgi:hypothetical protein
MFWKKKVKDKIFNKYPCVAYLHNALRFIIADNPKAAYEEICFAILKSGGELSDIERSYMRGDDI